LVRGLRVLNVYRSYFPDPPGGLQEAIRQICLATGVLGIENKIFTLSPTPFPKVLNRPEGQVVRCRSWAAPASCDLGGVAAFAKFRRLASESDVVHYFFPWPFADLLHAIACPAKPAVLTYISDIVRQQWLGNVYAPLMRRTLKNMKAVVANAPPYVQTSSVLSSADLIDKIRIIPLGIDEHSYPKHGDDSVLNRLGICREEAFILFIGVLRYYKGLHTLIEAAPRVPAKIVIAGSGPEGEALQLQAARLGASNVIFAGQLTEEEKVALLRHCRALVLPSHLRSEAYGMVLVEAAMFGRPMISCEIGTGTSFVNADGETGIVVPPENPQALAAAMNRLLNDEVLAERYGNAARQRYEQMFSGQALGKAYASLYREVVSHK
jgi:rhamnosyl/mannosyltransferase